jgi:hypothetical protein
MTGTGTRHDGATIVRARELAAAGWSGWKIKQLLDRELGQSVAVETVYRWIDPARRERDYQKQHRRNRTLLVQSRPGRLGSRKHTAEFQEHRAHILLGLGMGERTVARLMTFDYPWAEPPWTAARVKLLTPRG